MVKKNSPKCQRVKTLRKQNIEEIILFYLAFVFLTSISSIKKIIQETKVYCIWLDTIYNTFYQGYSFSLEQYNILYQGYSFSLDRIQHTLPGVFILHRHNTTLFTRGIHSPYTKYNSLYQGYSFSLDTIQHTFPGYSFSIDTIQHYLPGVFILLRHNITLFTRGFYSPQTQYNTIYQGYSFSLDTIQHTLYSSSLDTIQNILPGVFILLRHNTEYFTRGIHSSQTQYNTLYQGFLFSLDTIQHTFIGVFILLRHNTTYFTTGIHSPQKKKITVKVKKKAVGFNPF